MNKKTLFSCDLCDLRVTYVTFGRGAGARCPSAEPHFPCISRELRLVNVATQQNQRGSAGPKPA
jgi:hypothetical protein